MSGEDVAWFLAGDGDNPNVESMNSLDTALDALNAETLQLIDSVLNLDYARSARGRCTAERLRARAEELAAMHPDTCGREELLARLDRMREISSVAIAAAPRPTAAAIASARQGDRATWDHEAAVWSAGQRLDDTMPLIVVPRRRRGDTLPGSPAALREAVTRRAALAMDSTSDPTSDEAETP